MGSFPETYNDPTPGYVASGGCTVQTGGVCGQFPRNV